LFDCLDGARFKLIESEQCFCHRIRISNSPLRRLSRKNGSLSTSHLQKNGPNLISQLRAAETASLAARVHPA
jgi:hypothetical protein